MSLSVRDLERSLDWYCDVLGFDRSDPFEVPERQLRRARLENGNGFVLALTCHKHHSNEPFSERSPGIDHVALAVGTVEEVETCRERCARRGDEATVVEKHSDRGGAKVTLRDPDNIQLEVICPAGD